MNLCECGCGLKVTKEGNRFINGYNNRGKSRSHLVNCQCCYCQAKRGEWRSTKGKTFPVDKYPNYGVRNKKFPKELYPNFGMRNKHHSIETKKIFKEKKSPNLTTKGRTFPSDKYPNYGWRGRKMPSYVGKKISEKIKGVRNPGVSLFQRGRPKSIETRKKLSISRTGFKDTKETRRKKSDAQKKLWQNKEFREQRIAATIRGLRKRPTNLETETSILWKKYSIPLKYNATEAEIIIGGKIPDYVESNGRKICVEVSNKLNKKYMYNINPEDYEQERVTHFAKYGWKCLVIWEDELKDEEKLVQKIKGGIH